MGDERDFEHFILTRFSVRFTADQPTPDRDWLEYRLGLFTELAYVSMAQQTGDPQFRWLVFFDAEREPWFEELIDELAEGVFEPVWIDATFFEAVSEEVTKRASAPYVITTRFDSDDAVARNYISSVQAQFDYQERMFVNFQRGLQFERSGGLYSFLHPANAFVSLIEKRVEGKRVATAFVTAHGAINTYADVKEVKAPPMWLVVVHGSNLLNAISAGSMRARPEELAKYFDVEVPLEAVSNFGFRKEQARTGIRRLLSSVSEPKRALVVARNLAAGERVSKKSATGGLNNYRSE